MSKWDEEVKQKYPDSYATSLLAEAQIRNNNSLETLRIYDKESIIDIIRVLKAENVSISHDFDDYIIESSDTFKEINRRYNEKDRF